MDYLIVGQGLCGTWLSYYLQQAGASVMVIDKGTAASASSAASGIINPVTGKRLARQWMGDVILPFAQAAYHAMSIELQSPLCAEVSIHTYFSTAEEAGLFEQKAAVAEDDVLHYRSGGSDDLPFNYHYGIGTIHPVLLVDVHALLRGWRAALSAKGALCEDAFDWNALHTLGDGVQYKDLSAVAVIDCTGAALAAHPYFSRLPFALNKGEAIIADIPGLPRIGIYKYANLSIVPWSENRFWIGSTYDWDFKDELPTIVFCQKVEGTLKQWLRSPYALQEHFAAIRPATVTRDAFVGVHPLYPRVGILNGTGSKGCSLAPFLAHNLAEHLLHSVPLIPQVDVGRFARVLSNHSSR